MGWPMNIDSAWLPSSAADLTAWQEVLRARPSWQMDGAKAADPLRSCIAPEQIAVDAASE